MPSGRGESPERAWVTAADVRAEVQRVWDQGRILSARVTGEALFPLAIRASRPSSSALADRFGEVREWIRALVAGSREHRGAGYEILWREIDHRQLGRNRVPAAIVIPCEADALALIEKRRQAERFQSLVAATLSELPSLRGWLAQKPLRALEHADEWDHLLAILRRVRARPRPGVYVRQLDVPGVDTKFIEARRGLLTELLDAALPPDAVDSTAVGVRAFETRFGFRSKPPLVRLRVLDTGLAVGGLTDITAPVVEVAKLDLRPARVFITENEINGLAFPPAAGSVVVFGLGYDLARLHEIPWLARAAVHYWGDIDTHGFAMLNRLRSHVTQARSFLMDRETLLDHRPHWSVEPDPYAGHLEWLTPDEAELRRDLLEGRFGRNVRLEQERVGFSFVMRAVEAICRTSDGVE